MKKFIIEHLEPRLYKWCYLEYKHISSFIGKENLIFTNVKQEKVREKLKSLGKVYKKSVKELKLNKACLLDPSAEKTLTASEAKKFNYFIFGGILGDFPARKRTTKELGKIKAIKRNLTRKQMATDNACYVVKELIKGKELSNIKFIDKAKIKLKEGEEVILPYRYVKINGKPLISKEILKLLKKSYF